MVDFADIIDEGDVSADDAVGDGLLLQVPAVYASFIIGYPFVELLQVHDLFAAVAGGDVLFGGEVVATLPEHHHAVGQQRTDAVVATAVPQRQDPEVFLHLFVDFGLQIVFLGEFAVVDVDG